MENYSVLMSVYRGEKAEYLRLSMESIFRQTVPTNDFVLVCDGPLTQELDAVIGQQLQQHGDILRVIRQEQNQGLAAALNAGLPLCRNELVARMDSDDIAAENRCQRQILMFRENPGLAVVGGAIDEFEGTASNVVSHKQMPENHDDVIRYARTRNPFNHPTVMFRKSAVREVGGYPPHMLHEDYGLWAKLILNGAEVCNLPDTLCYMRVDGGLYDRRGGWKYLKLGIGFRWHLYRAGFYSLGHFLYVSAALTVMCLVPTSLRKMAYRLFLR